MRLTLESGEILELTADHEVLTPSGYKHVSELTCEDEIVSFD